MQKEIVARATLKKSDVLFSTGFIHINGNLIEGVFSTDYLSISLDRKKMNAHFVERNFISDESGTYYLKSTETFFQTTYKHEYIYAPEEYSLMDEFGGLLILSILEPVDSKKHTLILKELEKFRF